MLNNIFKKDGNLDADQVRANALLELALSMGEGSEGDILVIFDPKHFDDYRHVHAEFLRLKDSQKEIHYICKQVTEKAIGEYVDYIQRDLIERKKPKIYTGLFVRDRNQVDFVIKSIIDKGLAINYFVI